MAWSNRFVVLMMAVAPAWGGVQESPPASSEYEFFSEMPVVLSASRLSQPLSDIPGAMTVIDRETIRRMGARDLADVLRWVPGFQVSQPSGAYSKNAPLAIYHGLAGSVGTAMQVLIDGRSQYSPMWFGTVDFNTLPLMLEDVERIEILRGSNSASYGSNAMLGVVNIVTTEPALTKGGAVSVSAGGRGLRDGYARIGWGPGEFSQRLSVSKQSDDGLAYFRDSRTTQRAEWRGDMRLSPSDELRLIAGGVETQIGIGMPAGTFNPLNPERERSLAHYHAQADWTHNFAGGDAIRLSYYHVKETGRDRYIADSEMPSLFAPPPATVKLAVDYNPHVSRDDFEMQHTLNFGDAKRLVWGVGLRRDGIQSWQQFATDEEQTSIVRRLFGHLEWRLAERWLLNIGGMLEHESLSGGTFAPRAFLNYRLTENQTLKVGAYRAHQSPSIIEQKADVIWNDPAMPPGLPPAVRFYKASGGVTAQHLDTFEIDYLGDFRRLGLTVDARLSDERVTNFITGFGRNLPDACLACQLGVIYPWDYANGPDYRIRAFEYQVRWRTPWSSELRFNQSYIRVLSDGGAGALSAAYIEGLNNYMLNSAPRQSSSLHWMQELPWNANLTASFSRTGSVKWTSFPATPTVNRVDLRLALPFKSTWGQGEVAWISRAANGPIAEFVNASQRYNQDIIDPQHWITLRVDY